MCGARLGRLAGHVIALLVALSSPRALAERSRPDLAGMRDWIEAAERRLERSSITTKLKSFAEDKTLLAQGHGTLLLDRVEGKLPSRLSGLFAQHRALLNPVTLAKISNGITPKERRFMIKLGMALTGTNQPVAAALAASGAPMLAAAWTAGRSAADPFLRIGIYVAYRHLQAKKVNPNAKLRDTLRSTVRDLNKYANAQETKSREYMKARAEKKANDGDSKRSFDLSRWRRSGSTKRPPRAEAAHADGGAKARHGDRSTPRDLQVQRGASRFATSVGARVRNALRR